MGLYDGNVPSPKDSIPEQHWKTHLPKGSDDLSKYFTTSDDFTAAYNFLATVVASLSAIVVPLGGIIMWSGSIATIPANFALCNGSGGTIDLRDRFVVGAGNVYAVGNAGGANNTSASHTNNHSTSVDGLAAGANVPFTGGVLSNLTVGHTHTAHGDHSIATLPPYYALAYIQRVT